MESKNISHIPVLDEEEKLIGVFSESTIFSKLANEEIIGIDENEIIQDYLPYIAIEKHASKKFGFIGLENKIIDAKDRFKTDINDNKRLVMLFVTRTGRENQKVLGIVTPWDLFD